MMDATQLIHWEEKAAKRRQTKSYRRRDDVDEMDYLLDFIRRYEVHSILDVGCGFGVVARHLIDGLCDRVIDYILMEPTQTMRDGCYDEIGVMPMVWLPPDMPFEDGSIDLVFCHSVLMHCRTDQQLEIVQEMARVAGKYVVMNEHLPSMCWMDEGNPLPHLLEIRQADTPERVQLIYKI
jgi:SAM-dependent methyltransferase